MIVFDLQLNKPQAEVSFNVFFFAIKKNTDFIGTLIFTYNLISIKNITQKENKYIYL